MAVGHGLVNQHRRQHGILALFQQRQRLLELHQRGWVLAGALLHNAKDIVQQWRIGRQQRVAVFGLHRRKLLRLALELLQQRRQRLPDRRRLLGHQRQGHIQARDTGQVGGMQLQRAAELAQRGLVAIQLEQRLAILRAQCCVVGRPLHAAAIFLQRLVRLPHAEIGGRNLADLLGRPFDPPIVFQQLGQP